MAFLSVKLSLVEFDLIIKNATIVDGSGKSAYKGSIGVKGDKVGSVGDVGGDTKEVIDAKGLTAVPGFIPGYTFVLPHKQFLELRWQHHHESQLEGSYYYPYHIYAVFWLWQSHESQDLQLPGVMD